MKNAMTLAASLANRCPRHRASSAAFTLRGTSYSRPFESVHDTSFGSSGAPGGPSARDIQPCEGLLPTPSERLPRLSLEAVCYISNAGEGNV